jgi:hypothetical protein
MGAWGNTVLSLLNPTIDHEENVVLPILSELEMKRYVKAAIENIPGAHRTFNERFGGVRKASDYPAAPLLDAGVPTFLWCK